MGRVGGGLRWVVAGVEDEGRLVGGGVGSTLVSGPSKASVGVSSFGRRAGWGPFALKRAAGVVPCAA